MPLRNIGELTGMDVTWYSAKAENDVNAIFLRMPLSDSKRAEMETYATNLIKQLLDMRTDTQKIKNCASAVKNGGYTDYVVTDKATAMAALDSIKRKAQTIRSGMTEQENPIRYYNSSLMNELDFLIDNADAVMDRVKNGRVVLGSSNPDTSVVDQTAVMFGADNTMLDCERMVRIFHFPSTSFSTSSNCEICVIFHNIIQYSTVTVTITVSPCLFNTMLLSY